MKLSLSKGSLLPLAVGTSVGLLFGVGILVGTLVTKQQSDDLSAATATQNGELPLQAAGATVGNHISMATGQIDSDIEGVYVLDHQTGQLTCWVLNPRGLAGARGVIGKFTYNVLSDLGLEKGKDPDYVLTTGGINVRGGAGAKPANSVVYVADGNTGMVAGYVVMWNRGLVATGTPQAGPLVRVMGDKARQNIVRE